MITKHVKKKGEIYLTVLIFKDNNNELDQNEKK